MASHLTVIDSSLKRTVVKTTPGTNLSSVLEEACKKLGHNPDNYVLKHNDKAIDLARTVRLSALPNGAKLSLVQGSRSPSIINVALQLPPRGDSPSIRLQDKFPSNTPIWQILRRFESGTAGGQQASSANHNFTQQGTAQILDGAASGSGRLFYAMPVVNLMGRELGTLLELQKTLGQLGLNGGTCLLRLSHRVTEQPLEEAMLEISKYFEESGPVANSIPRSEAVSDTLSTKSRDASEREDHEDVGDQLPLSTRPVEDMDESQASDVAPAIAETAGAPHLSEVQSSVVIEEVPTTQILGQDDSTGDVAAQTSAKPIIFAPPSASMPAAAVQLPYNEEDYHPTIAHAQQHQARLNNESRNRRLQSDKELEDEKQALKEKLQSVMSVTIRFRFPDNSSVNQTFSRDVTARDLYDLCRELMDRPNNEPFIIKHQGPKGALQLLAENDKKLVMDLAWQARVVVTVLWADSVTRREPSLKPQYLAQAQELKVQQTDSTESAELSAGSGPSGGDSVKPIKKGSGGGDIEKKIKGFLRLGKK